MERNDLDRLDLHAFRAIPYPKPAITLAISLNYTLRKATRNRQAFPTSEAAMKFVHMALQNTSRRWTMPVRDWSQALNQLAIKYTGRVPV